MKLKRWRGGSDSAGVGVISREQAAAGAPGGHHHHHAKRGGHRRSCSLTMMLNRYAMNMLFFFWLHRRCRLMAFSLKEFTRLDARQIVAFGSCLALPCQERLATGHVDDALLG